jgi:ankyrin repeat protein
LSKKEEIGTAIIGRFRHRAKDIRDQLSRLLNDRDACGNTILGIAIWSDCSVHFISNLIENGAEIDPIAMPHSYTPLQAAALLGRLDVVVKLVGRGARNSSTYLEQLTAAELAQTGGHFEIVDYLSKAEAGFS